MLTKFFVAGLFAFCSVDAMAQCFATGSGSGSGSAPASTCPQVRISGIEIEWTDAGATVGGIEVAIINPNGVSLPSSDNNTIVVESYLDSGGTYNPANDAFYPNGPLYGTYTTLPDSDSVSYTFTHYSQVPRTGTSQTPKVVVLIKKVSGSEPRLWFKYSETFAKPTSNMPVIKGAAYHQDGDLTGAKYDIWTNYGFVSNANFPTGLTWLFAYSHINEAFALSSHRGMSPLFSPGTTAVMYRTVMLDNGVNSLGSGLKWKGGTFLQVNGVITPGEPLQDYLPKEFIHLPSQTTSKFFSY